jgi:thymidylate synthase
MSKFEHDFINGTKRILSEGKTHDNRTDTDTISVIGDSIRIDLSKGFPLLSSREAHWKGPVQEMLAFFNGKLT